MDGSKGQKKPLRYQVLMKKLGKTKLGHIASTAWNNYLAPYSKKSWQVTKSALWAFSTGAIVVLLPLALEVTIEGEAQAQYLASQIGEANQGVQYRPY